MSCREGKLSVFSRFFFSFFVFYPLQLYRRYKMKKKNSDELKQKLEDKRNGWENKMAFV